MMGLMGAEACQRTIDERTGEVTVAFDADHAQALADTIDLVFGSASYASDKAFNQAQKYWSTALDKTVDLQYKTADRDGKKLIAAWRQALDTMLQARRALLDMLYPDAPEITAEAGLTLYRDALIDACGHK